MAASSSPRWTPTVKLVSREYTLSARSVPSASPLPARGGTGLRPGGPPVGRRPHRAGVAGRRVAEFAEAERSRHIVGAGRGIGTTGSAGASRTGGTVLGAPGAGPARAGGDARVAVAARDQDRPVGRQVCARDAAGEPAGGLALLTAAGGRRGGTAPAPRVGLAPVGGAGAHRAAEPAARTGEAPAAGATPGRQRRGCRRVGRRRDPVGRPVAPAGGGRRRIGPATHAGPGTGARRRRLRRDCTGCPRAAGRARRACPCGRPAAGGRGRGRPVRTAAPGAGRRCGWPGSGRRAARPAAQWRSGPPGGACAW